MTPASIMRPSPSSLARLIICPAYIGAPFDEENRLKFQGLHAIAVLRVIARHIKQGFLLKSVERRGRGLRIDLEFQKPDGKIRVHEVKSARELTQVHKIQAALYWDGDGNHEIVLSNGSTDIVLPQEYLEEVHRQAETTRAFLRDRPNDAAVAFRPDPCVCRYCGNASCPFLAIQLSTSIVNEVRAIEGEISLVSKNSNEENRHKEPAEPGFRHNAGPRPRRLNRLQLRGLSISSQHGHVKRIEADRYLVRSQSHPSERE